MATIKIQNFLAVNILSAHHSDLQIKIVHSVQHNSGVKICKQVCIIKLM